MGDDNALPTSKKRAAGREISRDNPGLDDEEDISETEVGTFKKASDEVLAGRRIVKVRRQPTSSASSTPSSNPFAGIRLVPPVPSETRNEAEANAEERAENKAEEKAETNKEIDGEPKLNKESEEKTDNAVDLPPADQEKVGSVENANEDTSAEKQEANGMVEKEAEARPAEEKAPEANGKEANEAKAASDLDKSEVDNAINDDEKGNDDEDRKDDNNTNVGTEATPFSSFQQLSSSKNAFTGLAGTGFSSSLFSFGSVSKDGSPSLPSFGFGTSNNGSAALFGSTRASENKSEGTIFPSMQEVPVETGEENEDTVFTADSTLFEFLDGGWKERGKGEVKVNVSNTGTEKSRLVMRARGNYRLIMNANLYPDMKLTKMDKKGITFACVNSTNEGKTGLATFALKFKDASLVETFSAAITTHKGEAGTAAPALKTPENSPTAEEV